MEYAIKQIKRERERLTLIYELLEEVRKDAQIAVDKAEKRGVISTGDKGDIEAYINLVKILKDAEGEMKGVTRAIKSMQKVLIFLGVNEGKTIIF